MYVDGVSTQFKCHLKKKIISYFQYRYEKVKKISQL